MERKKTIGDPASPGQISPGGPGGRGGGGQFNLPKETARPVYEIWSRRLKKKVGEVTSREGATRAVDRRDIEYGGADHYFKRPGD